MNNAGDFQVIDAVEMVINHKNRPLSHDDIIFRGVLSGKELNIDC